MNSNLLPLSFQFVSFVFVITWVAGVLLVMYQFFREYRGKKYNAGNCEMDLFTQWKVRRNILIRRGIRIFIAGISFQVMLILVQYLIHAGN